MERSAGLPIWAGRPAWADDALLAAGLAAFGVIGTVGAVDNQPTSRPPGVVGWGLLLVASAAVALRRRRPLAVLAVTAAATAAWLAARHPYGPVFLPLCVAVYTAAAAVSRRRFPALAGAVGMLLVALVAIGVSDGRERLYDEVPNQLPRVLLALGTLLGVPLWVGWAAGAGGGGGHGQRQWRGVGLRPTADRLRPADSRVGDRRDARTGGRRRRRAGGRPPPRRRLPGHGEAAPVIRVVVADDQALFRAGFRVLLEATDDLELVGEAADGRTAVELARRELPDVVLMDVRMPGMDGIEATRAIAADPRLAAVRVVILTTWELDEYVFDGLRAGASGFLVKDTEPAELLRAVRLVAGGEALLSPGATRRLIADLVARPDHRAGPAPDMAWLTDREREVVGLVALGLANDEIAGRLVVSPATVRTHVSRAMTKLRARDRAQLVVFAYQSGLVAPGTPQTRSRPT